MLQRRVRKSVGVQADSSVITAGVGAGKSHLLTDLIKPNVGRKAILLADRIGTTIDLTLDNIADLADRWKVPIWVDDLSSRRGVGINVLGEGEKGIEDFISILEPTNATETQKMMLASSATLVATLAEWFPEYELHRMIGVTKKRDPIRFDILNQLGPCPEKYALLEVWELHQARLLEQYGPLQKIWSQTLEKPAIRSRLGKRDFPWRDFIKQRGILFIRGGTKEQFRFAVRTRSKHWIDVEEPLPRMMCYEEGLNDDIFGHREASAVLTHRKHLCDFHLVQQSEHPDEVIREMIMNGMSVNWIGRVPYEKTARKMACQCLGVLDPKEVSHTEPRQFADGGDEVETVSRTYGSATGSTSSSNESWSKSSGEYAGKGSSGDNPTSNSGSNENNGAGGGSSRSETDTTNESVTYSVDYRPRHRIEQIPVYRNLNDQITLLTKKIMTLPVGHWLKVVRGHVEEVRVRKMRTRYPVKKMTEEWREQWKSKNLSDYSSIYVSVSTSSKESKRKSIGTGGTKPPESSTESTPEPPDIWFSGD